MHDNNPFLDRLNIARQNFRDTFIANGYVDIIKTETLLKNKIHGNKVYAFLTHDFNSDIDSIEDFKNHELILKQNDYFKNIFLIAEIGINHNGDISLAKKLINEASKAGFDAVKFQKRTIEKVYSKEFLLSKRESPWGNTQEDQKRGLEFNNNQYDEIDNIVKKLISNGLHLLGI